MISRVGNVRFVFYFLIFVLLFFVGQRIIVSASNITGRYASCLLYPVLLVQHKIVDPIKSFFQHRRSLSELNDELIHLQHQKEELQADNIGLKAQIQYYHEIKELVDFKKRYDPEAAQLGHILFRQFSDQSHFFLVNAGSLHGIKPDMIALYKNCLVGRVSDVYPWYCKVIALTDSSCKVAVYCEQSASSGIHVGINNLEQASLERISHLARIQEGELILSSGEGMVFPRGFCLGCIKTFEKKGLWQEIAVEPLMNLKDLSYCLLIHKEAIR